MPSSPLFVYGLLRRGMSAGLEAFLGAGSAEFVSEATLSGKLYDLGEYPGVRLAADAPRDAEEPPGPDVVTGELWRLRNEFHWPALDDFEGIGPDYAEPTLYKRVLAEALTEAGEAVTCWVYVYNRELGAAPRIASGDWAAR